MRVTTLIENRRSKTDSQLVAEWGLSLHITFNGHDILFDTGTSGSFAKNAEHLSVNVAAVDTAVLSHHHFDHGGGLRRFLELNSSAKVHLGETPNGDCFGKIFGFVKKYVGLDKAFITEYADRFETVNEPVQVLPNVFVLPHIVGNHPKPDGNKYIFLKRDGTFRLDEFRPRDRHGDQRERQARSIHRLFHNGILNMVDTVAREFKGVPIKAVIGGFHLVAAPPFSFMAGSKLEVESLARSVLNYP
jgi:7,8-dihydropterin-6-yl-methyl-4-(beta-D-ribofuranosyl)aminobenzene 5'-phosphate synthase